MGEPMSWIRTLHDYGRGESDRCIKACGLARYEGGMWTCPVFKFGVDKVNVVTEGGLMCRLLDERGVEYKDRDVFGKHVFHWGEPLHGAMFTDGGEWTELVVENATPEQAVEATLGRGTCEILGYDDGYDEGVDGEMYQYADPRYFLSCEHEAYGSVAPNYCPVCGRKVVEV